MHIYTQFYAYIYVGGKIRHDEQSCLQRKGVLNDLLEMCSRCHFLNPWSLEFEGLKLLILIFPLAVYGFGKIT